MPDENTGKPPIPPWAWLFAAACFAIPVIAIGGAFPTALGLGGAFYCLAVSREAKKTVGRKLIHCTVVTIACWGFFIGLASGVMLLQKRFPNFIQTRHTQPVVTLQNATPSSFAQHATQLEEKVQQTAARLESATQSVLEDEAARRKIYSRAVRIRKHIEEALARRADWEARDRDLTVLDEQIAHMEEMHEQSLDFATRFHKISRQQLDEIIREGDRKGWPVD